MTHAHQLDTALRALKLSGMLATLDARLSQAQAGDLGHLEFLHALCLDEIARRDAAGVIRRVRNAHFEQATTLEDFDFNYNPSIPAATIRDLATLRFLTTGESIILHGPVGVGKTFIAQALGHHACRHGHTTVFTKTSRLLADLAGGHADRTWATRLRRWSRPTLLILDDFAMRDFTPTQADDLYELISDRAGQSLVLTSNRRPEDWYPLFPNPVVAESVLDRLINTAHHINMNGRSYRPNKRPKAPTPTKTSPNRLRENLNTALRDSANVDRHRHRGAQPISNRSLFHQLAHPPCPGAPCPAPADRPRLLWLDSRGNRKRVDKTALSESDICDRYITPALGRAGWMSEYWRREFGFTDGKMIVRGKLVARGKPRRADYLLFYKPNIPIAVIEAKDNKHSVRSGMQQALDYAERLDVPFVFSSNGDGFVLHDKTGTYPATETNLTLDEFPSRAELWRRYRIWRGIEDEMEKLVTSPNHSEIGGKAPRYYQQLAINRTIEAVAKGQRRVLLVMATGTGKTYTAFNIVWRLWKSGQAKRVLFLADRNFLVDQTIVNDFRPFGEAMTKLTRKLIDRGSGRVDQSYEIYLSLYQAIMGDEEHEAIYDRFPRDFFDLIVIDECHRGSAREDSAWREVLEYFDSAVQLGMTATPKETKYVSNIHYFGDPVYTYSLKQGIEDGFLAPFKVIRIDLDKDVLGWRPEKGEVDDFGYDIPDRIYNQLDFDRDITLPGRTKMVAERIAAHMHAENPMHKAIVFCEDIDHAERMREALVNIPENRSLVAKDHRYVMRITGDELEGKAQLDNFINPKQPYPVIATTSKLMTTGVDAQTCHLIVLDQRIQSLSEFKQIIGRGTRLRTDYEKFFFTILDFRKVTELFADPDWDGPPLQDEAFQANAPLLEEDEEDVFDPDFIEEILVDPDPIVDKFFGDEPDRRKYVVSGVEFSVLAERVQYYDKDGKLVTESLHDYTRRTVHEEFTSLDDFVKRWTESDRKQAIVDELVERGVLIDALEDNVSHEMDAFDLICHVAFDQPPLTRRERVENVRKRDVFTKYGETARAVLDALLNKYADQGIDAIEDVTVLKVDPIAQLGTTAELVNSFGGRTGYTEAVRALEAELYKTAS